jgi:hypothetical protein
MSLVVALVGGTAAAFGITERLKLERSPIIAVRVEKLFSPVCDCETSAADIRFTLRNDDRVTVAMVDADGDVVRTLVDGRPLDAGVVRARWDGRDDEGRVLEEGAYRPRVHLAEERRTILLPSPIRIDVTPPKVTLVEILPRTFSPDGDGRNDRVSVLYKMNEPAHALLYVNGKRRVRGRARRLEGKLDWFGQIGGRGVRAGLYDLSLGAEDVAGNVAEPATPSVVQARYVELGRKVIRVRARTRFGVRVDTDARVYRWRFAGGHGLSGAELLVLRAPRAGRYRLFVEANGHGASALVLVRPREQAQRTAAGR